MIQLDTGLTSAERPTWLLEDEPTGDPPPSGPLDPNRYEDLGLLGIGGMGEVRQVRDRHLRRVLAMKILQEELVGRPTAISRFVEEAQTTAQLEHPGIVPVHEIGRLADGRVFFTMKEVKGRTLRQVLDRAEQRVGLRRLVSVLHTVCGAVAYAHSRGVIHRDLKPENVMIGAFGEVLVPDWGISKVQGSTDDAKLTPVISGRTGDHATRMGSIAGTPRYMAPEQARGDTGSMGPWTDVWALGAMLDELLATVPPEAARAR